jgi:hypothetical protein
VGACGTRKRQASRVPCNSLLRRRHHHHGGQVHSAPFAPDSGGDDRDGSPSPGIHRLACESPAIPGVIPQQASASAQVHSAYLPDSVQGGQVHSARFAPDSDGNGCEDLHPRHLHPWHLHRALMVAATVAVTVGGACGVNECGLRGQVCAGCTVNVSDLAGEAPSTHGGSEDEDGGTTISSTLVPNPQYAIGRHPGHAQRGLLGERQRPGRRVPVKEDGGTTISATLVPNPQAAIMAPHGPRAAETAR